MTVYARDEVILEERRDKIVVLMSGNVLFICDTWSEAETIALYLEMMTWFELAPVIGGAARVLGHLWANRGLSARSPLTLASGGHTEGPGFDVADRHFRLVDADSEVLKGLVDPTDGDPQVENHADQSDESAPH